MQAQRGFTLLEVMVATSVLAVGLTAVSGGLGMTTRSTALASGYERARQVAESRLEKFLAQRPEDSVNQEGSDNGIKWQLRAETDPEVEGLLRVVVEAQFFAAGDRTLVIETREVSRTVPEKEPDKAG